MKKCKKEKCGTCTPKSRYCGEPLECIKVNKGESYDSALSKINEIFCSGGIEGITYEFEDNETCETKGFSVFENSMSGRNEVFSWCQDCCGNIDGTEIIINQLENQLNFNSTDGYPSSNQPPFIPNGISKFGIMDTLISNSGTYLITADFTMEYGGAQPASRSGIKTLFELRINGVQIPYSTRFVKVRTGTPSQTINTYSVTTEANINANDTIELWFNANTDEVEALLLVQSCTITAIKK